MRPVLSIVVVSRNEGANLRKTLRCLRATMPRGAEIVVVDDGSTDGSADFIQTGSLLRLIRAKGLGVTKARNLGARRSKGDVVLFSDAHVQVPEDWWRPLDAVLARPGIGAVAPCITVMGKPHVKGYGLRLQKPDLSTEWLRRGDGRPRPVPIVPGCFVAVKREVLAKTGGYDDRMDTWGMSDIEFSIRHWLLGYELWVVPRVEVAHLFRERHPYTVRWRSVLHNTLRTALVHFGPRRVARVVDALKHRGEFAEAMSRVSTGETMDRRRRISTVRRYGDEWYFKKFGSWEGA